MSKRVRVDAIEPVPGIIYGKVSDPEDFSNSELYAHQHVEEVTRDAIMAGAASALIKGFALTLTSGLSFSVATGIGLSVAGKLYDANPAPTVLTLGAAHATLPRIDLVYLLLEDDVQTLTEFRPYQRLRTEAELAAGTAPYLPAEFNEAQEVWNRATVQVRAGTPNASPTAPAANANEVPLFQVRVNATAVTLNGGNVTDVRPVITSLAQVNTTLTSFIAGISETVDDRVAALLQQGYAVILTYNDAGNQLTIAVDQSLLDARYANVTGDTMTGVLNIALSSGGSATSPVFLVKQTTTGGAESKAIMRFEHHTGSNDRLWDVGTGANSFFGHPDNFGIRDASNGTTKVAISTGGTSLASNLYGNWAVSQDLAVTGALSKGSGTFLIDHPLDPDNKDLAHSFVEAPRDDLLYSGAVTIPDGASFVDVDIDADSGMTSGTFFALTRSDSIRIYTQCRGGFTASFGEMQLGGGGGTMRITRDGTAGDQDYNWIVIAERADDYIKHAAGHDADGHLLVERDKEPLPGDADDLLAPLTQTIHASAPADPVVVNEVVGDLVGKVGYRRHAYVTGEGDVPTREVTIETVTS
jgi:hypothetical protein